MCDIVDVVRNIALKVVIPPYSHNLCVLELGRGLGELLSSDVTRSVVSHVPPCLPRRTAP